MYTHEMRIPKDRVAVLVGKAGSVKKKIQSKLKVKLIIDSREGDVIIQGEDNLNLYDAKNVIKAIGRGFNPETAIKLLKEGYVFELIEITEYSGKSKKDMLRLKGRVIGSEGKSRKIIEATTNTSISVYGKTIGIIGKAENCNVARKALESLLTGAPHGPIYKWLEENKKKRIKREFESKKAID